MIDHLTEPMIAISYQGRSVIKKGIPDSIIKDQILHPFFTTKPTGSGTGHGLSLSYDNITKGHGGTIEVVSSKDEGSRFHIKIPTL